jgi:nucleotide-binding universal stress UspA family protein
MVDVTDKPILICYDGSNAAHRAIAVAANLLSRRRAVVLDVAPPLLPEQSYDELFAPAVPDFAQDNARMALQRATAGAEQAQSAGFDATALGDVAESTWEGIVNQANAIDAAVIVIGSHGRHTGGEFLHGSVSHQVAMHAGRPVLIVPPPQE